MKTPPPLTDTDINDIDMLLGAVPAPFETVDAVILDGYLAGVLVQPVMLTPEQYLPPIFGTEGMPEPGIPGWTEAQHDKLIGLIERYELHKLDKGIDVTYKPRTGPANASKPSTTKPAANKPNSFA